MRLLIAFNSSLNPDAPQAALRLARRYAYFSDGLPIILPLLIGVTMIRLLLKSMKQIVLPTLLLIPYFASAAPTVDKDGVPVVDIHGTIVASKDEKALAFSKKYGLPVPSTRMISVDGKQISLSQFMNTYCQGKYQNETCVHGLKIQRIDSSSGPREKLPAGL